MTPEEIAAIIEQHKFPTLHAGDTGINVSTLQIWLKMLGPYQGPITGFLDTTTAQAVDAFRAQQLAAGIVLQAPTGAVLERDTWQAMDNLLQQRLPPDPDALDRLPLPRRSSYDSDEKYQKALYEGLRVFGFPIEPAAAPIRIPIAVDASGLGAMHGVPPGAYELQFDRMGKPAEGSAELHLEDGDGVPLRGHLRLVQGEVERSVTVVNGLAQVAGLAPGEYEVIIDRADPTTRILEDTGSLEIHLVDAHDKPIGGSAYLVGETGDAASIQRAVALFKALHRGMDSGLEPDERSGLGANFLTGRFDETAHHYHSRAWQSFTSTWGRFYGAPWMGIVFHPEHTPQGNAPSDLNWGTFQTVRMLQQWGAAYLQASTDEQDVLDRLQRPIAVRYIAKPLGGQIDRRNDFSQAGAEASLHLQRLSPRMVEGIPTGQYYGGIDYHSSEYSSPQMERQLAILVSLDQDFHALTPDDELVKRQVAPELRTFVTNLTNDGFPGSKSVNGSVFLSVKRFFKNLIQKTKKDEVMAAAREVGGDKLADLLDTADSRIFKWDKLEEIHSAIKESSDKAKKPGAKAFHNFAWEHVKFVQKALWWCRLLVAAGKLEKVQEWSTRYLDMGYGGFFKDYEGITQKDITTDLRFSFDDDDWRNPLQLESLVEFYINYNDPDRPENTFLPAESQEGIREPRLPWPMLGGLYHADDVTDGLSSGLHFVLIDSFGARNNAQGKSVTERRETLEKLTDNQFSVTLSTPEAAKIGNDLRKHPEKYVLWLPKDLNRASASYRINNTTVSGNTYTLSLDGKPSVSNNAPWQILQRSSWLCGSEATSAGTSVTLDVELSQINANMDTIYLAADVARPSRVYRILSVVEARNTVTVDGQPDLAGSPSAWRIPAGVGGTHPPLEYELRRSVNGERRPLINRLDPTDNLYVSGYDHYDGLLFVVHKGNIEDKFRFTSYTSHVRPEAGHDPAESLSIRGNRSYDIISHQAGGDETLGGEPVINFAFFVDGTTVRDSARYYHAQTVRTRAPFTEGTGRNRRSYPAGIAREIFIHFGFSGGPPGTLPGTRSAACQVSPQFYELRDKVLTLLKDEIPDGSTLYQEFYHLTQSQSQGLYNMARALDATPEQREALLSKKRAWRGKINGKLWLIRPEERPLADYRSLIDH